MKIEKEKEVVRHSFERVIIGRTCDICKKPILPVNGVNYNYFVVHTWHSDWGNDSVDSHDYYDACSPECALVFAKEYITECYNKLPNTREIEISHVQNLDDGAY